MRLNLTKEQFFILLKLVYLGNWLANSHRGVGEVEMLEEFEKLEDHIFSYAKEFGFGDYVDDGLKDEGKYFPTRYFEEDAEVFRLIHEYDDYTFWQELADRLAERDLTRRYGEETLKNMPAYERAKKFAALSNAYEKEFEKHGIERLEIKE